MKHDIYSDLLEDIRNECMRDITDLQSKTLLKLHGSVLGTITISHFDVFGLVVQKFKPLAFVSY